MNIFETPNYPVNSFTPKLSATMWEQRYNTEAPLSMIGASLIGALSGAISDRVDVEGLSGNAVPTSVNTLAVAGSGSRKTSVDRMFMAVFKIFEKKAKELLKRDIAVHKAAMIKWQADHDRIEKRLKTEIAEEEQHSLQTALEELLLNEPCQISIPKILYNDATPEAIAQGLLRWSTGLLNSNEAGAMLNSRTMSNQGFFNGLWGGEDLTIDRASQESFVVSGPRLTISLMVQVKTFLSYLNGKGSLAEDNGFLPRFLICFPDPLEGTRFNLTPTGSWHNLETFQTRLMEILMSGLPKDGIRPPRKLLKLSPEAHALLRYFSNLVEADLGVGRFLSDVKGSASKAAENVARLAGLFHHYEGFEGTISAETVQRAMDIVSWHLLEYKRLFGAKPQMPLEVQDAIALERTIGNYAAIRPGLNYVPKSYLFTHGPSSVRNKARLDLALQVLCAQNKIGVQRLNKKWWIFLNPAFFVSVNQVGYPQQYTPQLSTPRHYN